MITEFGQRVEELLKLQRLAEAKFRSQRHKVFGRKRALHERLNRRDRDRRVQVGEYLEPVGNRVGVRENCLRAAAFPKRGKTETPGSRVCRSLKNASCDFNPSVTSRIGQFAI